MGHNIIIQLSTEENLINDTDSLLLGVHYVLILPRLLQTLLASTARSIYSGHFKAIDNLTAPTSRY